MSDVTSAERYWAVGVGAVGLFSLIAGSFLAALPPVDSATSRADVLAGRRTRVLAGSLLTASAGTLLIWPVAAVATYDEDTWSSLALSSIGSAVTAAAVFFVAGLLVAVAVWRDPADPIAAGLLDGAHLATWALSAPLGGVLIVATTAAGVQGHLFGSIMVVLAGAKVVTVAIEVAGMVERGGWNAGGWALGSSGYVTVAWYAGVLLSLA